MAGYQIIHVTPEQKRWNRRHIVKAKNDLICIVVLMITAMMVWAVKGV